MLVAAAGVEKIRFVVGNVFLGWFIDTYHLPTIQSSSFPYYHVESDANA